MPTTPKESENSRTALVTKPDTPNKNEDDRLQTKAFSLGLIGGINKSKILVPHILQQQGCSKSAFFVQEFARDIVLKVKTSDKPNLKNFTHELLEKQC